MAEKPATLIFSLTGEGRLLGDRLIHIIPSSIHKHRVDPFIETVQNDFSAGHDCVFICATGIVIRALAPVLRDKYHDPAVVVLDEAGNHVIPLLSGHQGGAGALAHFIADQLNARCVVTSASNYGQPIYTLGIGCDRLCPVESIRELLIRAHTLLRCETRFSALASIDRKADEPGLITLAEELALPFKTYSPTRLREVEDLLTEKSDIVFKAVGCFGVAEAAALVSASEITGHKSELLLPKQKTTRATLAIARSYLPQTSAARI